MQIFLKLGSVRRSRLAGVAYSIGPEWLPPRTIQRWPGKLISELANKVPTAIEYESPSHSVKSWGFLCNTEDPASDIKEYFKLHLAPGAHQGGKITRAEAQRWLQDYIRCVCQHVTAHFREYSPLLCCLQGRMGIQRAHNMEGCPYG